jgi:RNA polymerase sigma-70 factor, ECF subfamily
MSQPWQRSDPPPGGVPVRPTPDEVVRAMFSRVWRMLGRRGIFSRADRDDLVQDVFEVVVRRLNTYDPTRSLVAWVLSITWRMATRHRQRCRGQHERLAAEVTYDPPDTAPDPEQQTAAKEVCQLVDDLLQRLGEMPREVVYLHDFEGLAMPDIASVLEISTATGYGYLRRGRKEFKAAVQRLSPRERASLGVRATRGAVVVSLFPIDLEAFFAAERQRDADAALVEARGRLCHRLEENARKVGGGGGSGGGGGTSTPAMGRLPSFSAAIRSPAQLVGAGLIVFAIGAGVGAAVYANLLGSPHEASEPTIIAARDVIFEATTTEPAASAPSVAAPTPSLAELRSTRAPRAVPVARSSTRVPASAGTATTPDDTEGGILSRARAAVAAGSSADAIKHLQRHQQKYPNGRMQHERELTWIQALALDNRP